MSASTPSEQQKTEAPSLYQGRLAHEQELAETVHNKPRKVRLGELLVQEGLVTPEQIEQALNVQKARYPMPALGAICVELGFISSSVLAKILANHCEKIPLGELLVHLDMVTQEQVDAALKMQKKTKKKLGTILVEQGHLTTNALVGVLYKQAQLANQRLEKQKESERLPPVSSQEILAAVATAREQGLPLGLVLVEKFRLSKEEAGQALSAFYKCPYAEFNENVIIPPRLLRGLSLQHLRAQYWIPLRTSNDWVEILIDDPHAVAKVQDIKRIFPGKTIRWVVGFREDIDKYIAKHFHISWSTQASKRSPGSGGTTSADSPSPFASDPHLAPSRFREGEMNPTTSDKERNATFKQYEEESLDENDGTVVHLVNQFVTEAVRLGTSDIHIEPYGPKKEVVIRFRLDGVCYEYQRIPAEFARPLVARLKFLSRLDIAERQKPQDGKFKFRLADREIELRIATLPTFTGDEDVVLRILALNEPLSLQKLQLTQRNHKELVTLLEKPYGMLLCVGPTGSGKTTMLHACLGHINTPGRKIWTAEDPVEITQTGLRQVQVHPQIGLTFASALRSFLRADPDVIMVGDIRDHETATLTTDASLTGHLVVSALHTTSAPEAISRLLALGLDSFRLADALQGIIAQRLVRVLCVSCKERYHPDKEEYDLLATRYGVEEFARLGIPYDHDFILYRGKGCDACHKTGYKGRLGIHELLVVNDEIRALIHSQSPVAEIRKVAQAQGMTTLMQNGVLKVLQGLTDYAQVKAVIMP